MEALPTDWRSGHRRASAAALGLLAAVLALGAARGAVGASVEVFAEFASQAGPGGVREARLWLDGVEVTDRSSVSALRISYAPDAPLPVGSHEARVEVTDSLGRRFERSWTFEVAAADPSPEVVLFWSDELSIELDALPRALLADHLRLAGTTQPEAEVEITRDGRLLERVIASATGRFVARVPLEAGAQDLQVQATRPWTGESGRAVTVRVERLGRVPELEDPPTLTLAGRPPARLVLADPAQPATRDAGDVRAPLPIVEAPARDVTAPGETGAGLVNAGRTRLPASRAPADDAIRAPGRGAEPPSATADGTLAAGRTRPPRDPGVAEVVITKPEAGDLVRGEHVAVLGRAPAGWSVVVHLDGAPAGDDVANPAGHFTVSSVVVEPGEHELVARATSPDGQRELASAPVRFSREAAFRLLGGVAVTAPGRVVSTTREAAARVEGTAWPGAQVEVAVNGRLVATDFATATGRFGLTVALEPGVNHVTIEAIDPDTGRVATAPLLTVRRAAAARRGTVATPVRGWPGDLPRPRLPAAGLPDPVGR